MNHDDFDTFTPGPADPGDSDAHLAADPDLIDLAARLDDLGAAERGAAPGGIEERLLAHVRAPGDAPAPLRYIHADRLAATVRPRRFAPLALAAAVAFFAAVGAVWMSVRGHGGKSPTAVLALEQDVNNWLTMPGVVDREFDAEVEAISSETRQTDTDFLDDLLSAEPTSEEGAL